MATHRNVQQGAYKTTMFLIAEKPCQLGPMLQITDSVLSPTTLAAIGCFDLIHFEIRCSNLVAITDKDNDRSSIDNLDFLFWPARNQKRGLYSWTNQNSRNIQRKQQRKYVGAFIAHVARQMISPISGLLSRNQSLQ
jgi:hypothetical protein